MLNRTKELCIRDGINSVEQFARLIGLSQKNALDLLRERLFICRTLLNRLCDLFNVSASYLLKQGE